MKAIIGFKSLGSVSLLMFAGVACWAQKPELVVEAGHAAGIGSLAISADGRMLASGGSGENTIQLWDLEAGLAVRKLNADLSTVNSLAFSPNGKNLASGDRDGVTLWDLKSGTKLLRLKRPSVFGNPLTYSPDGRRLAIGGNEGTVLVDATSGKASCALKGQTGSISSVSFSPDGKLVATSSVRSWSEKQENKGADTVVLWDTASCRELRTLEGNAAGTTTLAFSPNGELVATGGHGPIKLWHVASGADLRTLKNDKGLSDGNFTSMGFSHDGAVLAGATLHGTVTFWEIPSGAEIRTIKMDSNNLTRPVSNAVSGFTDMVFTPNGRTIVTCGYSAFTKEWGIKIWDVGSGAELNSLRAHATRNWSVAFSADGKILATGTIEKGISLWDASNVLRVRTFRGLAGIFNMVAFNPNNKVLGIGSSENVIRLLNVDSQTEADTLTGAPVTNESLSHSNRLIHPITFSADGKTLFSAGWDGVTLWDVGSRTKIRTIEDKSDSGHSVALDPKGDLLAIGTAGNQISLWNPSTGVKTRTLKDPALDFGGGAYVPPLAFSPDGKILATGNANHTVQLWNPLTGLVSRTLKNSGMSRTVTFSLDGKILASGNRDGTIKLWEVASGTLLHSMTNGGGVESIAFNPTGTVLVSASGASEVKVWSVVTGEELASLFALDESDWAVVTADGRFDASPGAQKLMHYLLSTREGRYETISLSQLKHRYYEPGLLQKLLGFNKEPLSDVSKFENPKLYPDVKYEPLATGTSTFTVTLTNRGGGIGRVQVFVNDKEFLADARTEELKNNPNVPQATLNIELSKATGLVSGKENDVRVVAWNVENYISSRGAELVWIAGGPTDRAPPEVYAIVGGISDYSGSQLDLNFAAKDAVDIANAIELGAKRLFGADKVHLTLLSTADDARAIAPTKENFTRAFEAARKAKPTDILIVYLAGHGITLQRGSDMYCYLTQEALTTDTVALSDSETRKRQTITSEELVEWIKQIRANKQVVMLDTCAAGAAQAQLKLVDMRGGSGDAIRAIDRAKDRTGSYILMGSAADAVSYEASQFGQGLLTYALLKGMKGAALRNDEFVDVSKLFQYAREEVEQLAKNIGGIQRPIIFAPKDDSFEVGQLNTEDKLNIHLATPRPMILRPRFLDEQADDDTLDLMKVLRARLRDESLVTGRGVNQGVLFFVDDEDFPGGIRPTGRYTIEGNKVTVTLRLRRDGVEIGNAQVVTGTKDDVPGLAVKVLNAVKEAVRKL